MRRMGRSGIFGLPRGVRSQESEFRRSERFGAFDAKLDAE